jgi:hypothetical protein
VRTQANRESIINVFRSTPGGTPAQSPNRHPLATGQSGAGPEVRQLEMSLPILFRPIARLEMDEAMGWYRDQDDGSFLSHGGAPLGIRSGRDRSAGLRIAAQAAGSPPKSSGRRYQSAGVASSSA